MIDHGNLGYAMACAGALLVTAIAGLFGKIQQTRHARQSLKQVLEKLSVSNPAREFGLRQLKRFGLIQQLGIWIDSICLLLGALYLGGLLLLLLPMIRAGEVAALNDSQTVLVTIAYWTSELMLCAAVFQGFFATRSIFLVCREESIRTAQTKQATNERSAVKDAFATFVGKLAYGVAFRLVVCTALAVLPVLELPTSGPSPAPQQQERIV